MVDFIKSLKQGLSSAEIAQKNKLEIDSVFQELNAQLKSETGGKIRIGIMTFEPDELELYIGYAKSSRRKPPRTKMASGSLASSMDPLGRLRSPISPNAYDAIGVVNAQAVDCPRQELAKWTQRPMGFPCTITIGKTEYICENKRALEEALGRMLEDPRVGQAIQNLLQGDAA